MGKERQHEQKALTSLGSGWMDEGISGAEMSDARLKARLSRFIKDMLGYQQFQFLWPAETGPTSRRTIEC